VTVPPLSVRIARCRVIRRDGSAVVKVPRKQVVMVDPGYLPGIYMARLVATLQMYDKMSSSDALGSEPLVGKSPSVVSVPPPPPGTKTLPVAMERIKLPVWVKASQKNQRVDC
jgi:hypothetical protein